MSEVALKEGTLPAGQSESRAAVLRRLRASDVLFKTLTRAAAITVLVVLSGTILSLVIGAAPGISAVLLTRKDTPARRAGLLGFWGGCAVAADGRMYCWEAGDHGELANGVQGSPLPVTVLGP